jgi:hypothetical protein
MFWAIPLLFLNAAYVPALPPATVFYVANVPLHALVCAAVVGRMVWAWRLSAKIGPLLLAGLPGIYLIAVGATSDHRLERWGHVALGVVGLTLRKPRRARGLSALAVAAAALRFGLLQDPIRNPQTVPLAMIEEGNGPKSPFWPSSARTNTGGSRNHWLQVRLCDLALTFGLGKDAIVSTIEIQWPSGIQQKLADVKADQRLSIREQ